MSETVFYVGKLFQVETLESETVEQQALRVLSENDIEYRPEVYNTPLEQVEDDLYEQYVEVNGKLYKYTQEEYEDTDDIFKATKNEDGSISYEVKYYNGGCGFSEALEYALNKIS